MKKLAIFLLVGVMLVSLAACGEKKSTGDTSGESSIESSESSSDESSESSSDESSEESKKD